MKIDMESVLHVVDKNTKFSAIPRLDRETSEKGWEVFLSCWVAPHVGYSDNMAMDQGTNFQSFKFRSLLSAAGINPLYAGVESHHALCRAERYYAYLRKVSTHVLFDHQHMNKKSRTFACG